jgi:beta-lactamase superfamily II metal-dependent hydrolase
MELPTHAADVYEEHDFLGTPAPTDLVYFVLNVGNADTQLLILPEELAPDGSGAITRHMVVVDVGRTAPVTKDEHGEPIGKLPQLVEDLADPANGPPLLNEHSRIRLLVATHPHDDHVAGIPNLLHHLGHLVDNVWDSGYFYRSGAWHEMMHWLEEHPGVNRFHPTSGNRIHLGRTVITALSPSISLRNNYDTRGVYINNASIAALVEFPTAQVFTGDPNTFAGRQQLPLRRRSLLLGADSQTVSWAHVEVDFPNQEQERSDEQRRLGLGSAKEPLAADVFKVPHHCSKNGLNLELVSRVNPTVSIISSAATESSHAFPHSVAIEQLREALQPVAGSGGRRARKPDPALGLYCTADRVVDGIRRAPLGTIAAVIPQTGQGVDIFRFGDTSDARVEPSHLTRTRRVRAVPTRSDRTKKD